MEGAGTSECGVGGRGRGRVSWCGVGGAGTSEWCGGGRGRGQ